MDIKNRSPAMAGPERSPQLFCNIVPPFPLPVTHTFEQTSSYEQALQKLLKDPIRFLLATSHTFEDEAKMAPVLRPRKRLNESQAQQANRMNVRNISSRWGAQQGISCPSRGFRNRSGTDCYMNSVIQALLHVPKFVNWLESEHEICTGDVEERSRCVACALRVLAQLYWSTDSTDNAADAAVTRVIRTLRDAGWNETGQQDAHDFYQGVISTLQSQLPMDAAVIEALFVSTLARTLICPDCQGRSTTNAVDCSMGVPFDRAASLVDLIHSGNVLGPETMHGVTCGKCHIQSDRPCDKRIATPPEILVVQIRRFICDRSTNFHPRVRPDYIPFSERLDLSAHIKGQAALKYRLLGVVHHRGTLSNGHYITVARGPDGNWEEMDDSRVLSKGVRVARALRPGNGWSPYLLFWERVGGEVVEAPTRSHDERFWAENDRQRDKATIRRTKVRVTADGISQKHIHVRKPRKSRP